MSNSTAVPVSSCRRGKQEFTVVRTEGAQREVNGNVDRDAIIQRERPAERAQSRPRFDRSQRPQNRPAPRVARPVPSFSHDDVLASLKGKHAMVQFSSSGDRARVQVINADKFALFVEFLDGTQAGVRAVLFKHAIESIDILPEAPQA